MASAIQARARWLAVACVIALGVSIPISTALDNVLLALLLLSWVASGLLRDTLKMSFKNNYLRCAMLLAAALALGTLYGTTPLREALAVLGKYADLLAIPIIVSVLREEHEQRKALLAFAVSIALTVVLSWALWLRIVPSLPVFVWDGVSPSVFKYKATHNILVSFGVFLFAWLAAATQSRRARMVWIALALLAAANVLFLVDGATGYLLLGALSVLWVAQRLRGRPLSAVLLAVMAAGAVLLATPNPVRDRMARIVHEATNYQPGRAATGDNSTGVRMEFYRNTLPIIAEQPLLGVGTGGFARAYAQQVEGTAMARAANPHSEFLGITVQLGVCGLILFLLLWWTQWRAARELNAPMARGLMQGLVLAMVLGCAVNSLLLDHTEGLFYAWLSGVLLARPAPTCDTIQRIVSH